MNLLLLLLFLLHTVCLLLIVFCYSKLNVALYSHAFAAWFPLMRGFYICEAALLHCSHFHTVILEEARTQYCQTKRPHPEIKHAT